MTNPVLDTIFSRRSHRSYTNEQLTDEQLGILLDAAQAAPSARNTQPWHITVVQNQALLDRIHQAALPEVIASLPDKVRPRYQDPNYHLLFHAPTVFFYSCPSVQEMRYGNTDCGISIQNLVLAAESIGLGSCIVGLVREAFNSQSGDTLRRALCFPEGYDFLVAVAVGYASDDKPAHTVKEGRISYVR